MPFTTTTLAELTGLMADRQDQSLFWTPEEARLGMNEALRDWNLLTGAWRRRITLSTAAATPEVDLAATLTFAMRVRLSTGQPLHPASIAELDLGNPQWRLQTTASGGSVPTAPLFWAPVSLTQIAIWPSTAGVGVNNLLVDGVAATPVLVELGDTVDIGDEELDILVDYAVHCVAFKEGGPRWKATKPFFQTFLQAAAERNSLLKTKQAFRRIAGLDRKRDLTPTTGATTKLDTLAQGGDGLPPLGGA